MSEGQDTGPGHQIFNKDSLPVFRGQFFHAPPNKEPYTEPVIGLL